MNKEEFVAEVRVRAGLSRREASEAVDAVFAAITRAVSRGEKVTIPGFGVFEPRLRAPRAARDPRTGEPLTIPVTRVPVFRPSAAFRQKVDGPTRASRRR